MKYRLESKGGEVDMILSYGDDEFLVSWVVNHPCNAYMWRNIWHNPPLSILALVKLLEKFPGMFTLADVPADLSFAAFWAVYAHKVGNKGRAEKLWDALGEGERVAALRGVAAYRSFLVTRPTMEQAFAETWLNQRRWEN